MRLVILLALASFIGSPALAATPVPVPAYQEGAALEHLPPPLPSLDFADPTTRKAYAVVKRIPKVIAQLPCYCYCDRSVGHKSLYSCFLDTHGANCGICQREVFLADRLARKGIPAKAIRQAIIRGDWQSQALPR